MPIFANNSNFLLHSKKLERTININQSTKFWKVNSLEEKKNVMEISLEQQKLISSPLRAKIIYLLSKKEMTAKQVADELEKTTGSIHYHIQQLYHAGILELTGTKNNKGIIEKYYRSKAVEFKLKDEFAPKEKDYFMKRGVSLSLSEGELNELIRDFDDMIEKYLLRSLRGTTERKSYQVYLEFKNHSEEDE